MFEHWHEFYLLLGTAAAALVALLFVAASIGVDYLTPARSGGARTFMSPVGFHYTAVLVFSLAALAPWTSPQLFGVVTATLAVIGVVYSLFVLVRVVQSTLSDGADVIAYGATPAVAYAIVAVAGRLFFTGNEIAAPVYACALVMLIVVNIRNAWDLMLSMIWQHSSPPKGKRK